MKTVKIFVVCCLLFVFSLHSTLAQTIIVKKPQDFAPAETFSGQNCNNTTYPEFNPLRPYPGSPCKATLPPSVAFQCSPTFNATAVAKLPKDGSLRDGYEACSTEDMNIAAIDRPKFGEVCRKKRFNYNVELDFSNVKVPVLGNTEDPTLRDDAKINGYLQWYLGGVLQEAEQKPGISVDRLVNYSGPVKKLLPLDLQTETKLEIINYADRGKVPQALFHDYVIGCRTDVDFDYLAKLYAATVDVILGAGGFSMLKAYSWQELAEIANLFVTISIQDSIFTPDFIRLTELLGVTSAHDKLKEIAVKDREKWQNLANQINTITRDTIESCEKSKDYRRLSDLEKNPPPDPRDYRESGNYWEKYLDWRGYWAIPGQAPIENPLSESLWAKLFRNVPFASLEDTAGQVAITLTRHTQASGVISDPISSQNIILRIAQADSKLYYPHVRNINAMSRILASFSAPYKEDSATNFSPNSELSRRDIHGVDDPDRPTPKIENKINQLITPGPLPQGLRYDNLCTLSDITYYPPGDALLGGVVKGNLAYTQLFVYEPIKPTPLPAPVCIVSPFITEADCRDDKQEWCGPTKGCCNFCTSPEPESFKQTTEGRIAVYTQNPLVDEIYDKLVSGESSVLSRFFPKAIKDKLKSPDDALPASSTVDYKATLNNNIGAEGGKATAGDNTAPQIYFAKLGSLFDYILGSAKEGFNLQKLLRPLVESDDYTPGAGTCEVPQSGLCSLNNPKTRLQEVFGEQANNAAMICNKESIGGRERIINDGCLLNPVHNTRIHTADYSVGLFQINMLAQPRPAFLNTAEGTSLKNAIINSGNAGKTCYEAFSNYEDFRTDLNSYCVVGNQPLLDVCVEWFSNPENNVAYAKYMSNNGQNWNPWSTAKTCNIVSQ